MAQFETPFHVPSTAQPQQLPTDTMLPSGLTIQQEIDLMQVPEAQHEGIIMNLRMYNQGQFKDTTVFLTEAGEPLSTVVNVQTYLRERTEFNRRKSMPEAEKRQEVWSAQRSAKAQRAQLYAEYVEACRRRKSRIAELKSQLRAIRGAVGSDPASVAWIAWATAQRADFETWVASERVKMEALVASRKPGVLPGAEEGAMRDELAHLEANLIQRPELPPL